MQPNRRSFLLGAAALVAMPAVVRAESLMRLAPQKLIVPSRLGWLSTDMFGYVAVADAPQLYTSLHGAYALARGGRLRFRAPRKPLGPAYVMMNNGTPIVPASRPDKYTGPDGKLLDYYPPLHPVTP